MRPAINDGGPCADMTKRDVIAETLMGGLVSNEPVMSYIKRQVRAELYAECEEVRGGVVAAIAAQMAVRYADALIRELAKDVPS